MSRLLRILCLCSREPRDDQTIESIPNDKPDAAEYFAVVTADARAATAEPKGTTRHEASPLDNNDESIAAQNDGLPESSGVVHSQRRRRSSSNTETLAPLVEDETLGPLIEGSPRVAEEPARAILWNVHEGCRNSCPAGGMYGTASGLEPYTGGAGHARAHSLASASRNGCCASPVSTATARSMASPMRHDFMTLLRQASNRGSSSGILPEALQPPVHPWSPGIVPGSGRDSAGGLAPMDWPRGLRPAVASATTIPQPGAAEHSRRQRRASAYVARGGAAGPDGCGVGGYAAAGRAACCATGAAGGGGAGPRPSGVAAVTFTRCSSSPDFRPGAYLMAIGVEVGVGVGVSTAEVSPGPDASQPTNGTAPGVPRSQDVGGGGGALTPPPLSSHTPLSPGPGSSSSSAMTRGTVVVGGSSGSSPAHTPGLRGCDPRVHPMTRSCDMRSGGGHTSHSPLRPRELPPPPPPFSSHASPSLSRPGAVVAGCQTSPAGFLSSVGPGGSYQHGRLLQQLREQHERRQVLGGSNGCSGTGAGGGAAGAGGQCWDVVRGEAMVSWGETGVHRDHPRVSTGMFMVAGDGGGRGPGGDEAEEDRGRGASTRVCTAPSANLVAAIGRSVASSSAHAGCGASAVLATGVCATGGVGGGVRLTERHLAITGSGPVQSQPNSGRKPSSSSSSSSSSSIVSYSLSAGLAAAAALSPAAGLTAAAAVPHSAPLAVMPCRAAADPGGLAAGGLPTGSTGNPTAASVEGTSLMGWTQGGSDALVALEQLLERNALPDSTSATPLLQLQLPAARAERDDGTPQLQLPALVGREAGDASPVALMPLAHSGPLATQLTACGAGGGDGGGGGGGGPWAADGHSSVVATCGGEARLARQRRSSAATAGFGPGNVLLGHGLTTAAMAPGAGVIPPSCANSTNSSRSSSRATATEGVRAPVAAGPSSVSTASAASAAGGRHLKGPSISCAESLQPPSPAANSALLPSLACSGDTCGSDAGLLTPVSPVNDSSLSASSRGGGLAAALAEPRIRCAATCGGGGSSISGSSGRVGGSGPAPRSPPGGCAASPLSRSGGAAVTPSAGVDTAGLLEARSALPAGADAPGSHTVDLSIRSLSGHANSFAQAVSTAPTAAAAVAAVAAAAPSVEPAEHSGAGGPCGYLVGGSASCSCSHHRDHHHANNNQVSRDAAGMPSSDHPSSSAALSGGGSGFVGDLPYIATSVLLASGPGGGAAAAAARRPGGSVGTGRGSSVIASETSLAAIALLRSAAGTVALPDDGSLGYASARGSTVEYDPLDSGAALALAPSGGGGGDAAAGMAAGANDAVTSRLHATAAVVALTAYGGTETPPSPFSTGAWETAPGSQQHLISSVSARTDPRIGLGFTMPESPCAGVPTPPSPALSTAPYGFRLEDGLVSDPLMLLDGLCRLTYVTSGAYAAVYKGYWDDRPVAIKFLASTSLDLNSPAVKEALLGPGWEHDNIIHTLTTRVARVDARAVAQLKAVAAAMAASAGAAATSLRHRTSRTIARRCASAAYQQAFGPPVAAAAVAAAAGVPPGPAGIGTSPVVQQQSSQQQHQQQPQRQARLQAVENSPSTSAAAVSLASPGSTPTHRRSSTAGSAPWPRVVMAAAQAGASNSTAGSGGPGSAALTASRASVPYVVLPDTASKARSMGELCSDGSSGRVGMGPGAAFGAGAGGACRLMLSSPSRDLVPAPASEPCNALFQAPAAADLQMQMRGGGSGAEASSPGTGATAGAGIGAAEQTGWLTCRLPAARSDQASVQQPTPQQHTPQQHQHQHATRGDTPAAARLIFMRRSASANARASVATSPRTPSTGDSSAAAGATPAASSSSLPLPPPPPPSGNPALPAALVAAAAAPPPQRRVAARPVPPRHFSAQALPKVPLGAPSQHASLGGQRLSHGGMLSACGGASGGTGGCVARGGTGSSIGSSVGGDGSAGAGGGRLLGAFGAPAAKVSAAERLLDVLRTLRVVGPVGQALSTPHYVAAVVMEFANAGNLDTFSRAETPCDLATAVNLLRQVASGMMYLHAHGLVHGDLKPANVLLLRHPATQRLVAKVADFGLSGLSGQLGTHGGADTCGTVAYSAPERLAEEVVAEQAADVYSFGICMQQLVSGQRPFADLTYGQILFGVLCRGLRPTWPPGRCEALEPLYNMCCEAQPAKRPTFDQVVTWLDSLWF